MKRLFMLTAIFLVACGPSQEKKEEIAIITCNIITATERSGGGIRIKEINAAREKMGEDAFLGTSDTVESSLEHGLCVELVLNDTDYDMKLATVVDAKQAALAAVIDAKEAALAAERMRVERLEETARIAREAESKERDRIFANVKSDPEQFFIGLWKIENISTYVNFKSGNLFSGGKDRDNLDKRGRWRIISKNDLFHLHTKFTDEDQAEWTSLTIVEVVSADEIQQGWGESRDDRPTSLSESKSVTYYVRQ